MNFLPFIFSFLLILVLGNSILFSSFRSCQRLSTILLSQQKAYLELLSVQSHLKYQENKKLSKKNRAPSNYSSVVYSSSNESYNLKPTSKKISPKASRLETNGVSSSKFNLWTLWEQKNLHFYQIVYQKAVALLELLYQDYEFYRDANDPHLAKKILDNLLSQPRPKNLGTAFLEPPLTEIYIKMLKGTASSYSSLEEYFKIEKPLTLDQAPIHFRYASIKVLQAVFGENLTTQILNKEKEKWENNHFQHILTEAELKNLIKESNTGFNIEEIRYLFSFTFKEKGLPQFYTDDVYGLKVKNRIAQ